MSVLRLHTPAVEDSQIIGGILADGFRCFATDEIVSFGGDLRSSGFAGADCPHRLVGDSKFVCVVAGNFAQGGRHLAAQDPFCESGLALLKELANADDCVEAVGDGAAQLAVYAIVSFAEILASLGVADDHLPATNTREHAGGNFSGVCALFFPMHVLRADFDASAGYGFERGRNTYGWRKKGNLVAAMIRNERRKFAG